MHVPLEVQKPWPLHVEAASQYVEHADDAGGAGYMLALHKLQRDPAKPELHVHAPLTLQVPRLLQVDEASQWVVQEPAGK